MINGGGYDNSSILNRVADSVQKVRRGEAAFERDGVAFAQEDYRYPLLAALFYVIMRERRLNVLDFGGSLGSTYFQNRKLLGGIPLEWNVVEQENFVEYGKRHVPEVNFYQKVSDCRNKDINCLLMSSSINYVDEPYRYLNEMLSLSVRWLIIDRTYFNFEQRDRTALEHVPESIYKAIYPITLLNIDKFGKLLRQNNYRVVFYMPTDDALPVVEGNSARLTPCHGWLFEHI